jgi:hypothetical protein
MQKFMKLKLTVLTVCTLFCLPAWSEVKVVLAAHRIVKTDGTERSMPGDKAKPGRSARDRHRTRAGGISW